MAISSRQAGANVQCPTCGEQTQVPLEDEFELNAPKQPKKLEDGPLQKPLNADDSQTTSDDGFREEPEGPQESLSIHDSGRDDSNQSEEESFIPGEIGGDDDSGERPLTFRRHKNLDEEMDLTPMVDVTFQLLIFFMVSASFSLQKSIEVPTPDPDQKGASQQVQTLDDLQGTSIIVKIDASNTILIDDEPLGDILRITDALRDKMRREQKTELLVTADNQSLHRTIIAVIDAANEVGMQKIRMTSRKKAD
jgi:biopolymer transport protein ExbD